MRKKLFILLTFFFIFISFALSNRQVRLYVFAQQQQGILQFESPAVTIPKPQPDLVFKASAEDKTQQVDWVFDNQGRCWNAWSSHSCGLQQHEGGVAIPSMKDFNHDGIEDISCSLSSTTNGTTITNISNKTITLNCEKYTCMSCTSGNGIHAQCDGGIDKNADRVVETVDLTPGCVATCTFAGVFGSCLEKKTPPQPSVTNSPTPTIQANLPTIVPTLQTPTSSFPTTIPPTSIPNVTQIPNPTNVPVGMHLPVSIDYSSYDDSYNKYPPTYVYAMMNRAYNAQNTQRGINGLAKINGNVTKMLMISELNALEQILQNHSAEIKSAGITWIGYNAERDGRTPQTELTNIFSSNPTQNIINRMGRLAEQYQLKLMLGPTTPMWEEYFKRSDIDAVAKAMIGDNCNLDGIAFQEQKQISRTNKAQRAAVIAERTAFFRNQAVNCPHFESSVQIMHSWCQQNSTLEECRGYYNLLKNLEGPSRINSIAIWASGNERNELPSFIDFLRN
jgi:hypothetical protein